MANSNSNHNSIPRVCVGLLPMSITLGVGGTSLNAPLPVAPASARVASAAAMESRSLQHQHIVSSSCSVNSASTQLTSDDVVGGGWAVATKSILQMGAPLHPVAEFLFQLTKMLTENNTEFIEWRNASIFVHDPPVRSLSISTPIY